MSEDTGSDKKEETVDEPAADATAREDNAGVAGDNAESGQAQSGPTFTEAPDPLAGVRRASRDAWDKTEGKTVSMRTYIGTIVAVIVLMLLARCG